MRSIIQKNKGFVILFAVTLTGIILAIALGVADIAFRENKFATNSKDANDAFFAADTGIECALFFDKPTSCNSGTTTCFPVPASSLPVACASATPSNSTSGSTVTYSFMVTGLGSTAESCAKVIVTKDGDSEPPFIKTKIVSKGYNIGGASCSSSNKDPVEREINVRY
jgi:hypothetical protein